ncbi:MAG: ROK family protein [Blastocatellia bacterium]
MASGKKSSAKDTAEKKGNAKPVAAAPVAVKAKGRAQGPLTMAIDIGGTGLKASVLNAKGDMITDRVRIETPENCGPKQMITLLKKLVAPLPECERVSVGFPGVVRRGRVLTAHNLGTDMWKGFNLNDALTKALGKPVRVLNDADVQGLGVISGEGVELVITLGTGVGSSLFEDGHLAPHLEMAHHPFRKGETYEQQLGKLALEEVGKKRWNERLRKAIACWNTLTMFDYLYLGGGNAKEINFKLPANVRIVSNEYGMRGGIWLWQERHPGGLAVASRTGK